MAEGAESVGKGGRGKSGALISVNNVTTQELFRESLSSELFFALVGPVGAGCTYIAEEFIKGLKIAGYEVHKIKISNLIRDWAYRNGKTLEIQDPANGKTLANQKIMQDFGDEMRSSDSAAVIVEAIKEIRRIRAEAQENKLEEEKAVMPDNKPRAFILDSLKQPAEVELLRAVYRNSFALIGVVCDPEVRKTRVLETYFKKPQHSDHEVVKQVSNFIERDSQDKNKDYGQQVTETFHHADYFIDNTEDKSKSVFVKSVGDEISRLISILRHIEIVRPRLEESAMHAAASSQRASACLSRQVGAALVDVSGNIVSVGTNEAPRAGGGTYAMQMTAWEYVASDHRCAYHDEWNGCRNTKKQRELIDEIFEEFPQIATGDEERSEARRKLKKTRIGQLIEFSRAVHAEMDAILSAARIGAKIAGGRLFATTYPCHYCARHLVAAGVHEVQFIEPYPKSLALELHADAITTDIRTWVRPPSSLDLSRTPVGQSGDEGEDGLSKERISQGKVLFRPFVGVAPRLYERAFTKDRGYKNSESGDMEIGVSKWGSPWAVSRIPYAELEVSITKQR